MVWGPLPHHHTHLNHCGAWQGGGDVVHASYSKQNRAGEVGAVAPPRATCGTCSDVTVTWSDALPPGQPHVTGLAEREPTPLPQPIACFSLLFSASPLPLPLYPGLLTLLYETTTTATTATTH
ncbi:hypothetical protein E2C01_045464 [Portunus trituberculatus]|uniref:Uncharacterized protein n=1 Tax=Portunus trituberculatus TaxID=210409 RepID=A0A5B7G2C9_PORTR|nr:hypothetical protein [Portunus trituberculatus]